jgi:lipopolysaccharide transport system ATP-binding protein
MKPLIEIKNISKKFRIRHERQHYLSLRDSLASLFRKDNTTSEDFYALSDVSFDVQRGESIGIIGKNGAGKSTLLKILSRITPPTSGKIIARGRMASLLEVGTGFHPELTGRENIFLNGSILGMRRTEIEKNFDAIVDFAGTEKFLDTPLKQYSSGMQLRLAFAVAAFLENEILIIDEVLAVGDAEFQKKCLGKMEDVSRSGRTVLFVSHNLAAVRNLCSKGIFISSGKAAACGDIDSVITVYQQSVRGISSETVYFEDSPEFGNHNIRLISLAVKSQTQKSITVSSGINFHLEFENKNEGINLDSTWELKTIDEIVVFHTGALVSVNNDSRKGIYSVGFKMEPFSLNAGRYYLNLIFGKNQRELLFHCNGCYYFDVENDVSIGTNSSVLPGILRPDFKFDINFNDQQ